LGIRIRERERERERERARRTWAAWASADSALVGSVSAGSVWAGQVLAGRVLASCDMVGFKGERERDAGGLRWFWPVMVNGVW
jgi:hypothetical protein